MSTTQTINAVLDAVETTAKADATLTALLGDGANSIEQRGHDDKILRALQQSVISTPALFINCNGETWRTSGLTHERTMSIAVDLVVKDESGIQARENTAYPIIDAVYDALNNSQLGLTSPAPTAVVPKRAQKLYEVLDAGGAPLEISAWRVEIETTVYWSA